MYRGDSDGMTNAWAYLEGTYCPNLTVPYDCPAGSHCPTSQTILSTTCPAENYRPIITMETYYVSPPATNCPNTGMTDFL